MLKEVDSGEENKDFMWAEKQKEITISMRTFKLNDKIILNVFSI